MRAKIAEKEALGAEKGVVKLLRERFPIVLR